MLAHIPPALPNAVLLDSDNPHSPWTRTDPRFNSSGSAVHDQCRERSIDHEEKRDQVSMQRGMIQSQDPVQQRTILMRNTALRETTFAATFVVVLLLASTTVSVSCDPEGRCGHP